MTTTGAVASDPTMGRLRADVQQLASFDRRTTGPGERRSTEWIAGRLAELGASDVAVTEFRSQSSWAPVNAAYALAGLAMSAVPGDLGGLLAAALAVSYEFEVSGRNQWMRRLLPARRGASVSARVAATDAARSTLVLVAHHDAAHNGMVWHPRTVALDRMWSKRTGDTMPTHAPVLAAIAAQALPVRSLRVAARFVLAVAAAAMFQSARSYTTPGANDNATGVASVLDLADRLQQHRFAEMDVLLVFPGGEEAGNTGMWAWVHGAGRRLDPASTLVVNLDSLGSGGYLVVARREGLTGRLDAADVQLATDVAAAAGIELREVAFPNVCDTSMARHRGMHAVSLLSYEGGWIRNLHMKSDTVDQVRWNTVQQAVTLVEKLAVAWSNAPKVGRRDG
jgi:hypothetical protein